MRKKAIKKAPIFVYSLEMRFLSSTKHKQYTKYKKSMENRMVQPVLAIRSLKKLVKEITLF